jgi:hypothetical protein
MTFTGAFSSETHPAADNSLESEREVYLQKHFLEEDKKSRMN